MCHYPNHHITGHYLTHHLKHYPATDLLKHRSQTLPWCSQHSKPVSYPNHDLYPEPCYYMPNVNLLQYLSLHKLSYQYQTHLPKYHCLNLPWECHFLLYHLNYHYPHHHQAHHDPCHQIAHRDLCHHVILSHLINRHHPSCRLKNCQNALLLKQDRLCLNLKNCLTYRLWH